jgi:hypothetical protein
MLFSPFPPVLAAGLELMCQLFSTEGSTEGWGRVGSSRRHLNDSHLIVPSPSNLLLYQRVVRNEAEQAQRLCWLPLAVVWLFIRPVTQLTIVHDKVPSLLMVSRSLTHESRCDMM